MKHIKNIFFLTLVAIAAGSCGKSSFDVASGYRSISDNSASMAAYRKTSVLYEEMAQDSEMEIPEMAVSDNGSFNRKLTKSAQLRIRVEDRDFTERLLPGLVEKYEAWLESSESSDYSLNYAIRVPSPSYDTMLGELAALGRVIRRTESAEDVTLRYYDLEGRLATQRELLKTYQGYLGRARNVEEIMTVESRIADLQREIDWTGSEFRAIANRVDYALINVEVSGAVSDSQSRVTLGDKMEKLFNSFGYVLSTTLVVLTGILIYGIPAVIVLVLGYWVLFGRIGLLKKLFRLAAEKEDK